MNADSFLHALFARPGKAMPTHGFNGTDHRRGKSGQRPPDHRRGKDRPLQISLLLSVLVWLASACGGAAPIPAATLPASPVPPTATVLPSATALPTATSAPTSTPTLLPATATQTIANLRLETGLSSLTSLNFSDDGRYLAVANQEGIIAVWEVNAGGTDHRGTKRFEVQIGNVLAVVFSADGEQMTALDDERVYLWQTADGSRLAEYPCAAETGMKLQFTPQGSLAVSGIVDEAQVNLTYLPSSEQQVFTAQDADVFIKEASLSPDGKWLALGRSDGVIELYEAATGQLQQRIAAHTDWVTNLAFSPDSRLLASDSISSDPHIYIWQVSGGTDYRDGKRLATPESEKWDAGRLSFSPGGKLLLSQSSYGTKMWRVENWSLYTTRPGYVRFAPDDSFFAEPEGRGVNLWQVETEALAQFVEPEGLRDVAFLSSGGQPLAALGLEDGVVLLQLIPTDGKAQPPTATAASAEVSSSGWLYEQIEATYSDLYGEQYVEWDEDLQVYLVHGFSDGQLILDPLPIQTRQGETLATALVTIRLLNLHQGKRSAVLAPLAIELPDGRLYGPGQIEMIPPEQKSDFLRYLRETFTAGHAVSLLVAPDAAAAHKALEMPATPWQDEVIRAYQDSWAAEMDAMIASGQAAKVNDRELLLIPLALWVDLVEPLQKP